MYNGKKGPLLSLWSYLKGKLVSLLVEKNETAFEAVLILMDYCIHPNW